MRSYRLIFFISVLSLTLTLQAQELVPFDVDVFDNGQKIMNPFTGGLKAGQFSKIDFDNDGLKDLFVFDRNSAIITTYLNKGGSGEINYEYAPQYESLFPKPRTFGLLHDFNNDGIEDLFKDSQTEGIAGIEVWRGKRDANGLYFELIENDVDYPNVLYFLANGFPINVYNAPIDLPGIGDVDKDGDTDILTFEPDGSYLNYYRNYAVEKGLGIDTFVMELEDICFGGFLETMFSSEVLLDDDNDGCANGFVGHPNGQGGPRHAGSTVLPLDSDCDDDTDLLLGDFLTSNLVFLENGGSLIDPWITDQDAFFPNYDTPASMEVFLASFYLDINNDGKRDLIVTPNQEDVGQNQDHVWLYLNEGTDCGPIFKLHQKDFLLKDMLHFSSQSHPLFLDYNEDGLIDILVGNGGIIIDGINREHRFYLLENVGDENTPTYNIVDSDYLNLSENTDFIGRIAPEVGDIDGDGDQDLIFGHSNGGLYFYENIAGAGNTYDFKPPKSMYENIFVGQNASPVIFDVDNDGLLDLSIGEKNNEFSFFKNFGSETDPIFEDDITVTGNTRQLGNIRNFSNFEYRNGAPTFFYSNDEIWLLQGTASGKMRLFNNIIVSSTDTFDLVNADISTKLFGDNTNADLADINNNGLYDIIIGNERGGLHLYSSNIPVSGSVDTKNLPNIIDIDIYPNPARDILYLQNEYGSGDFAIYNTSGSLIYHTLIEKGMNNIHIDWLIPGVYMIQVKTKEGIFNESIIKH